MTTVSFFDKIFSSKSNQNHISLAQKNSALKLFTDGGARGNERGQGIGAAAWAVLDHDDKVLKKGTEFLGSSTNNQAEYWALIYGLKDSLAFKPDKIICYSDSQLLINQMRGEFKIKNQELKKMVLEVKKVEKKFKKVDYQHVGRNHPMIRTVDRLLNKTLDANLKT